MIYSTLSDEELERWAYSTPGDSAAKEELLSRTGSLLDGNDRRVEDLDDELKSVRDEYDWADQARHEAEEEASSLAGKLEAAEARIAELTSPEGLV